MKSCDIVSVVCQVSSLWKKRESKRKGAPGPRNSSNSAKTQAGNASAQRRFNADTRCGSVDGW